MEVKEKCENKERDYNCVRLCVHLMLCLSVLCANELSLS